MKPLEARAPRAERLLSGSEIGRRNFCSWPRDRGRERLSPSPPSEPGVQFSRNGLSSQVVSYSVAVDLRAVVFVVEGTAKGTIRSAQSTRRPYSCSQVWSMRRFRFLPCMLNSVTLCEETGRV